MRLIPVNIHTLLSHLLPVTTLTHTSVHGYLCVRIWLSWVQSAHMTASVKCGFGWQRKESLYLWNSKRLHAIALRGENAKLACHSLIEMSFPYVWSTGSIFSCKKKNLFLCNFHGPCFTLSFFFFNNTLLQLNFLLFLGWGSLVVVWGVFLFPESTKHRSRAPYRITREENLRLQLLLIRVKCSRPTNSYWTPKRLCSLSLSLPLCLSVPSSPSVCAKCRLQGEAGGGGCVARGLDGSGYCSP